MRQLWLPGLVAGVCFSAAALAQPGSSATAKYSSYFLKVSDYPVDATHDYNPNGRESQGVTHDNGNWYFTSTVFDGSDDYLWRVPVSADLNANVSGVPGAGHTHLQAIPPLVADNYNHWGDPDHYEYAGTEYLVVPMTSGNGLAPAVAFFRAP